MGHARAVANAPDPEALTRDVIHKGLSVRQTEDQARREKNARAPRRLALSRDGSMGLWSTAT